jgi:hypothetical protein
MQSCDIKRRTLLARENGLILYSSLLLLSVLMVLGAQAVFSTQTNLKVSANLRGESRALFLAEAGIEWSKAELTRISVHPPGSLSFNQSISSGSFSVATLSSIPISPLSSRTVVRSTGQFSVSTQIIQAQLTKAFQLADAALVLRGNATRINLNGNSLTLSGFDHDPTNGQRIANGKSHPAMSVPEAALKSQIESSLSQAQQANIAGTDRNGATTAVSDSLPAQIITQLSANLCTAAGTLVMPVPTAGSLLLQNQNWGTRAAPQILCIEGLAATGDAITFAGNVSGNGILIVRDADLVLEGPFRWEGLVIVTGSAISFKVESSEDKQITGAILVNGTDASSYTNRPTVDIQGAIKVLFSRAALSNAAVPVRAESFTGMYNALPYELSQNYWKILTP